MYRKNLIGNRANVMDPFRWFAQLIQLLYLYAGPFQIVAQVILRWRHNCQLWTNVDNSVQNYVGISGAVEVVQSAGCSSHPEFIKIHIVTQVTYRV